MKIHRNMNICNGDKSCGLCLELLPPLKHGDIDIGSWVLDDPENEILISQAIIKCPQGAIEVIK